MHNRLTIVLILVVSISSGCGKKTTTPMQIRHGLEPELAAYVSEARAHYMGILRSAAVDYQKRFQPSHPEVMFDYQDSTVPIPYRYRRVDLASGAVSPPNATEIHTDLSPLIEPFTTTHRCGIEVTVFPLAWNVIEVRSDFVPADYGPLTAWVWRWIDDGDKKPQDELGFAGCIHSVSFPEQDRGVWTTTVDLGSAPVEAFDDLMGTLAQMGFSRVSLRSSKSKESVPKLLQETPGEVPSAPTEPEVRRP